MFRRFRNAAMINTNGLGPLQLRMLSQANQLLAARKPAQAAPLFASLGAELETGNHPRRAGNMHAEAAHCYADSQDGPQALIQARLALNLFLQYQVIERSPAFYANITRKLIANGLKDAADTLQKEYAGRVGQVPSAQTPPGNRPMLPTNCPKCGAPIHSEQVNWIDASTAECEFCGSLIRPE
jgi:hypothetical protein